MSQPEIKASLVANLTDVTVETCLRPFGLGVPVTGVAAVKTELSTAGANVAGLIRGLSGTLKLNSQGGAVPVDFTRLLTTAAPLDGEGWSHDSLTPFDTLDADCRLVAGHISCQMFNMQTRRGLVSGTGDVDLGQQTLDWSLSVASLVVPMRASQVTSIETAPKVSIRGPLSQPKIRRADRPTLGEGSTQGEPARCGLPALSRAKTPSTGMTTLSLRENGQCCGAARSGRNRHRALGFAVVVALSLVADAARAGAEDTLSVATWGGAYGQSQEIAYFEPYAKETGTNIATQVYDGTLAKIKQMIGGDASPIDVVDVSSSALGALCTDGLLETIEASSLGAAPGGESAEQDFFSGALTSCGVASVAWSTGNRLRPAGFHQSPAQSDRRPA